MLKKPSNYSQLKDLSEPDFNQKSLSRKIGLLEKDISDSRKKAFSDDGVDVEALQRKLRLLKSYRVRLESLRLMNSK